MRSLIRNVAICLTLSLSCFSIISFAEPSMQGVKAPAVPGLEKYRGQPILIDFWASWCEPCRESFPWMNKIKAENPGLKVVAINLDEDRALAEAFLKANKANFKILFDPKGALAEKFKVGGMPSSYLIDRRGKIVKQHVGFFAKKKGDYEKDIKKLVAGK